MASSSSSNSSSSALVTLPRRKNYYDVFVTFRGEDTRNNFTDHLFDAIQRKNIIAFRDDTNLQKGESIGPELLRAIEDSQIFVVVFSRNYASSTWCLQELEKIVECSELVGKHILPVFYDVDPSEVRKQNETYGEAFVKHEQRFQQDSEKVQRWRKALTQVADLSGWDLREKRQSPEINKIVQKIINILGRKLSPCVSKDLVGIDSPIQELEKLLLLDKVDDVRAVGICGMGGIGKTTFGMVLYDRISHQFGACCFIDDVSKKFRLHDGPLSIQKQILHQTLGEENHQICNHYNTSNLIQCRLCHQRVLMILDNVDKVEQLEKIGVCREWLGGGSKIVIISRDEHILKEYGVDVVYKVPLLNERDSLRLFCRKAFKLDHILNSYEGLVYSVLDYAKDLPLAIKVLGSFLYGRDISEWRSALTRLRESPEKDVMDVLQLSFDGLKESEKEIFLHIACFFKGRPEKEVKNILNCCGFHADIGLSVVIDKSLIYIEYGKIKIHGLLEELGRKIVQENSSKEQRKWSRIWLSKQFYDVMLENMGKNVEAVVLDNYNVYYNEDGDVDIDFDTVDVTIFDHLPNLRLLILKNVWDIGSLSYLSNELRYVEWWEYPFKYLPSSFQPNQLVELILERSSIKQLWEGKKSHYMPKLKTLDLFHSEDLEKMPYFGDFPNLERLNLEGCIKLVQLDPSIGLLRKLVYLNLEDCKNLISIPKSIFALSSLEDLNLSGCSKAFNNRRHLNISESASHSQSISSISKWTTLPHHSSFPTPTTHTNRLPSFISLYCLRDVDISFCSLSQVPLAIGCLHWLEKLDLGGNNFVKLPSLKELSKLVYLNLEHCKLLKSLPQLPVPTAIKPNLRNNNFENNRNYYRRRLGLVIFNCPKLGERECYSRMTYSWLIQFIQANPQYFDNVNDVIDIVIPASEMPSWFNNQSNGHSIRIDTPPIMHDIKNNLIGLICCSMFSIKPIDSISRPQWEIWARISMDLTGICYGEWSPSYCNSLPVILKGDHITVKSNHIWLVYVPLESSWKVNAEIILKLSINLNYRLDMKVRKCGYRWVYKQDLQEFNLTTMHPGNSSSLKRKFLAIEDEGQP